MERLTSITKKTSAPRRFTSSTCAPQRGSMSAGTSAANAATVSSARTNGRAEFARGAMVRRSGASAKAAIARARPRVLINTRASRANTAHTQLSAAGLANVKSMGFMATSSTVSAPGVVPPRSRRRQSTVTERYARQQCQNLRRQGRDTASSGAVPWWSFQVD